MCCPRCRRWPISSPAAPLAARAAQRPGAPALRWTRRGGGRHLRLGVLALGFSTRPSGQALRLPAGQQPGPGDQLLMLDDYLYDVPFYWKLAEPVFVLSDWRPAVAGARDNWRKELFDAGRFEPGLRDRLLLEPAALWGMLCAPRVTWIVGARDAQAALPWLARARAAAADRHFVLWRFDGADARASGHCPETPTPGLPEMSARR